MQPVVQEEPDMIPHHKQREAEEEQRDDNSPFQRQTKISAPELMVNGNPKQSIKPKE
jgi:hypothetical protein